ncbi:MAG: reverse transcriptase domain-containing protein [Alphaproteobacteria bacterium]
MLSLLTEVVGCEIKVKNDEQAKAVAEAGIVKGKGLRQGMPLSPLLSNLVLNEFDKRAVRKKFRLLRYADDLIGFGTDEDECKVMMEFIKTELEKLELEIPDIKDQTKTVIHKPNEPVIFLGVEIYKQAEKYNKKIPKKTWDRAVENVRQHALLEWNLKEGYTLPQVVQRLKEIPGGYKSAFPDCTNLDSLRHLLEEEGIKAQQALLAGIFGEKLLSSLTAEQKIFLGLPF